MCQPLYLRQIITMCQPLHLRQISPPGLDTESSQVHFCPVHFAPATHTLSSVQFLPTVTSEITPTLMWPSLLKSHQHWYFISVGLSSVTSEITPTPIRHIGRSVINHFWNHTNTDTSYRTVCHQSLLKSHQHWYLISDRHFWNHTNTDTSYVTVISEIPSTLILHIGRFVISHFWNHTNTDTSYRTVCHQSLLTDRHFWNYTNTNKAGKTGRMTAGTEVKWAGYFLLSQLHTTGRV